MQKSFIAGNRWLTFKNISRRDRNFTSRVQRYEIRKQPRRETNFMIHVASLRDLSHLENKNFYHSINQLILRAENLGDFEYIGCNLFITWKCERARVPIRIKVIEIAPIQSAHCSTFDRNDRRIVGIDIDGDATDIETFGVVSAEARRNWQTRSSPGRDERRRELKRAVSLSHRGREEVKLRASRRKKKKKKKKKKRQREQQEDLRASEKRKIIKTSVAKGCFSLGQIPPGR